MEVMAPAQQLVLIGFSVFLLLPPAGFCFMCSDWSPHPRTRDST